MNRLLDEYGNYNIKELQKAMDSFSYSTDIPITVYDDKMNVVIVCNKEKKLCSFFNKSPDNLSKCLENLNFSLQASTKLGESYIFTCPCGLINIAMPLLDNNIYRGGFIAGPIFMQPLAENMVETLFSKFEISPNDASKIFTLLKNSKFLTPEQVRHVSYLLYNVTLSLLNQNSDYVKLRDQNQQQAQIGEQLYEYKKYNIPLEYPYEKEKLLIEKVKEGNQKDAQDILKSILNEILLIEYGNIEIVKARVLELCAILSRASVEGGASLQKVFGLNFDFITSLSKIDNLKDLCFWTTNITNHFIDNVFENLYSGTSYIMTQAVHNINSNYMNKITLEKLAAHLYVNKTYLSKLFNKEMGTSFSIYLNEVRIKKSKELLSNTTMSIIDIALYVGYENQSYFTKMFKKITNTTPKKYRDTVHG